MLLVAARGPHLSRHCAHSSKALGALGTTCCAQPGDRLEESPDDNKFRGASTVCGSRNGLHPQDTAGTVSPHTRHAAVDTPAAFLGRRAASVRSTAWVQQLKALCCRHPAFKQACPHERHYGSPSFGPNAHTARLHPRPHSAAAQPPPAPQQQQQQPHTTHTTDAAMRAQHSLTCVTHAKQTALHPRKPQNLHKPQDRPHGERRLQQ
jgi:hypothetical protein